MTPQTRTAAILGCVAAAMVGAAFAAVPLYNIFCRVTGFAGQTNTASAGSDVVLDRTIRVRFDANIDRSLPWSFRPVSEEMELKIGETGIAFFEASNPAARITAGTASFNVTPYAAGAYFTKIDCFCFTEQVLGPGESAKMPVTFYVDPAIVDDTEAREIDVITLSYTFYETELPDDVAPEGVTDVSASAPLQSD